MIVYFLLGFCLIIIAYLYIRNKYLIYGLDKCEKTIMEEGIKNHEYKNQLIVVSGYLNCHNYDKASDYLKGIIDEYKNRNINEMSELSSLPDGGIKNLFQYKLIKMDYLKIDYYFSITDDSKQLLEKIDKSTYSNLTKILGVLLDNAIDESKSCSNKYIEIYITKENEILKISISNRLSNNINKKYINKDHYTTKGIGHSFGLRLVRNIVKKDDNIKLETDIKKDIFIQNIYLICRNY